jgi:hypothetical protein
MTPPTSRTVLLLVDGIGFVVVVQLVALKERLIYDPASKNETTNIQTFHKHTCSVVQGISSAITL